MPVLSSSVVVQSSSDLNAERNNLRPTGMVGERLFQFSPRPNAGCN